MARIYLADKETLDSTHANTNAILAALEESGGEHKKAVRYGIKINKSDSGKKSRVTYLYDAVGMTPAAMNYTDGTFNYGSWGNVEFVKNNYPCMVKFDGTEDYKLLATNYALVKPQYMYEQMAHHSVMRVFVPIAMRGMYYHVYGSIPGKGVHRGKRTVERWIREDSRNCKYIYKLDIRHFFESVPHRRLKKALKRKIRDRELLKKLFIIIDSHKPGLPLGYYPSQWFGNFYLQPLDHFIMEQLHVKHYIRYMDDMVIFGNNKKELHKARLQIEKFITEELGLQIKKNWQVFRFDYVDRKGKRRGRPLDFMGFKFYRDRTTIRKSILQGIRGKVNRVKRKEKITWVDAGSLLSRLGWIWHSDTYAYYERYIKPYVKVKVLKTLVSKHARKENIRNGMVRSRKHRRRKTERAGYNKQPAPCI